MTNKELDDYMKTVNPNFDSHIEKGTIEMSNEYYNLLEEKMARLINENQELKKQLETYEIEGYKQNEELNKMSFDIRKYKTQQKEFINYLEEEIKTLEKDILETVDDMDIYMKQVKSLIIEVILQKYKEIIGDDKE